MEVGWGGSSWLLCVHLDVSRVVKVAGKIITQKDNIMAGIEQKYSGGKIGKISLN